MATFQCTNVVRRNGEVVEFNPTKIAVAITKKAYIGVHGHNSMSSVGVREQVAQLTNMVILILQGVNRMVAQFILKRFKIRLS